MENIIVSSDNYKIKFERTAEGFEYSILDRNGELAVSKKFETVAMAIRYAEDELRVIE